MWNRNRTAKDLSGLSDDSYLLISMYICLSMYSFRVVEGWTGYTKQISGLQKPQWHYQHIYLCVNIYIPSLSLFEL